MTRAVIYLVAAIAAGAAGWLAAGAFVARVGMSDTVRIAASGGLLLMAVVVLIQIARRVGAGREQPDTAPQKVQS